MGCVNISAVKTNEQIYIIISQTGTIISNILKFFTRDEYNHISIGLDSDLHYMFSFGRKNAYFPFWGGFVIESRYWGTFKRFSETKVLVLSVPVEKSVYEEIRLFLNKMQSEQRKYHYNYLGVIFAGFNIHKEFKNRFYCSEFTRFLLQKFSVTGSDELEPIVKPIDFLKMSGTELIYRGKLKDFNKTI